MAGTERIRFGSGLLARLCSGLLRLRLLPGFAWAVSVLLGSWLGALGLGLGLVWLQLGSAWVLAGFLLEAVGFAWTLAGELLGSERFL